jgi:hypothetical protein
MEHNDKKRHRTETNDFITVQCLGYDVTYNPDILNCDKVKIMEVVQIFDIGKIHTFLQLWSFDPPGMPSTVSSGDLIFDKELISKIVNSPPKGKKERFDNFEYETFSGNPYVKIATTYR